MKRSARQWVEEFPADRAIVVVCIIWLVVGGGLMITSFIDGRDTPIGYTAMLITPFALLLRWWLEVDLRTLDQHRNEVDATIEQQVMEREELRARADRARVRDDRRSAGRRVRAPEVGSLGARSPSAGAGSESSARAR